MICAVISVLCSLFFSAALTHAAPPPSALFVVLGGFHSCTPTGNGDELNLYESKIWHAYSTTLLPAATTELGTSPQMIAGCFGTPNLASPHSELAFRFAEVGVPPKQINLGSSWQDLTELRMAPVLSLLTESILKITHENRSIPVYIIGHSYGGWTAMRLVSQLLENHPEIHSSLRALYTIDPISPLHCSPSTFISAAIESIPGCQRAPSDISGDERIFIRDHLQGRWLNFYETQFHRLHSSRMPELEEDKQSFKIRLEYTNPIFNDAHNLISKDRRIWAMLSKTVLKDLAELRQH